MDIIDSYCLADIDLQLTWKSASAQHTDGYAAREVNIWRDWFPQKVSRELHGLRTGDTARIAFDPTELFGEEARAERIDCRRFSKQPRIGRFYPKGCLSGFAGIFPQNVRPFRCVQVTGGRMDVVMGHPLAGRNLNLTLTVGAVNAKRKERGGSSNDWLGLLCEGPGMQARWRDAPTDFFSGPAFTRNDEEPDNHFYTAPRLVHHLDRTAREGVTDLYRRFIFDGARVLDLMSSWTSHLPPEVRPEVVTGLGMNPLELEQNPRLTGRVIYDLNADPRLPFADAAFDVVVCTVSVEYLTHPLELFAQVRRVLTPGGVFVLTFSNRWFPPKAVRIWEELHEFERMGLVMEYFLRCGGFERLETYSRRGLPRPLDDKYADRLLFSDPLYAVWGQRAV